MLCVTENHTSIQLNNLVDQRCRIEILRERSAIGSTDFHQQLRHLVVSAMHGQPSRRFRDQKSGDNGPTVTHTHLGYANFGVYLTGTWQRFESAHLKRHSQGILEQYFAAEKSPNHSPLFILISSYIERLSQSLWYSDMVITNEVAMSVAPFCTQLLLNTASISGSYIFKVPLAQDSPACGNWWTGSEVWRGQENRCWLVKRTVLESSIS